MRQSRCRELFLTFFKIGAFTFGGGYAMLPLIRREVAEGKQWLTEQEIFDMVAIAESTPGPLAINAATFVGRRVAGWKGALAATLGVVLPSFVVILAVSELLLRIEQYEPVRYAFMGIRAGVLVLIGSALFQMLGQLGKNVFTFAVLLLAFAAVYFFGASSIAVLILCGAVGGIWRK